MSDYPPPPPPPGPPGSGGSTPPPPPPPGGGWGAPPPPGGGGGWGSAPPPPPPGPGYGYGVPYPGGPTGYSVGNAFSYGFKKFGENVAVLILITLLLLVGAGVVQVLSNAVIAAATDRPMFGTSGLETTEGGFYGLASILSFLFGAISFVVNLVIQSGIIKGALSLTRGQPISFGSAFNGINWGQVFVTAIITGVLTFVGLLLCIIPGILVIIFTSYALFFVIDRNQDAVTAIKSSVSFVKDNFGQLLLFWLATIAAYIVGACLCGVGLLVAIPVVVIAQAYTFRTLTNDPVTA